MIETQDRGVKGGITFKTFWQSPIPIKSTIVKLHIFINIYIKEFKVTLQYGDYAPTRHHRLTNKNLSARNRLSILEFWASELSNTHC